MSSVRNETGINEVGYRAESYKYDASIIFDATKERNSSQVDLAVTAKGNGIVGLAADGEKIVGKLELVEADGICAVQVEGGCELKGGTGATLTAGSAIVGALNGGNKGYIRNVAPATLAEVAVAKHEIYSAADATKVSVMLSK